MAVADLYVTDPEYIDIQILDYMGIAEAGKMNELGSVFTAVDVRADRLTPLPVRTLSDVTPLGSMKSSLLWTPSPKGTGTSADLDQPREGSWEVRRRCSGPVCRGMVC